MLDFEISIFYLYGHYAGGVIGEYCIVDSLVLRYFLNIYYNSFVFNNLRAFFDFLI